MTAWRTCAYAYEPQMVCVLHFRRLDPSGDYVNYAGKEF